MKNKIIWLRNNGRSIKEISNELNLSYKSVWRFLKKNGFNTKRKTRKVNHNIFKNYSIESCYWAGFIAADGNIRKESPYIGINLSYRDINHLKKFKNYVSSDANIKIRTMKQKSGIKTKICSILVYSNNIVNDLLVNFNLVPCKTKVLKPPIQMPNDFINHFIRGYFDGDGSISWNKSNRKPRLEFASGSLDFIKWIKKNISYLNVGFPKILQDKKWRTFKLDYSGFQSLDILRWLYNNSYEEIILNRKYKLFLKYSIKEEEHKIKIYDKIKRDNRIIELRNNGLSYREIGTIIGACITTCYNVYKSSLRC